ncbi:DUF6364 family protein [Dyadobacter sp. CY345]|uniref:DUF6364 family protein n=1 Tax=Dyadobacter sp. CY345 TaxID=2909335 RepID=UPI001F3D0286|nr:DUF6364 family protein [Dyadobacter sp. CY345]MCF2446397.1 DUF6364 family protein [Dyadobacter sp. CY345]
MAANKEPKVKLTLTVKKSVIEEAKRYASLSEISISNLVEDYLATYSKKNSQPTTEIEDFKESLPYKLMGFAKDGPLSKMTDDEIRSMRVKEKFGL